jgi:hypothetical protein
MENSVKIVGFIELPNMKVVSTKIEELSKFDKFLIETGQSVVLVNHYQTSGENECTYSWHYELWTDKEMENGLPQSHYLACMFSDQELQLGVEELLMAKTSFEVYNTSNDQTLRLFNVTEYREGWAI